jgi:hypothetical protein
MMWILSLVVVLATLAGSLARRSRDATTAMRPRKPAQPAMPTPTESPSPS